MGDLEADRMSVTSFVSETSHEEDAFLDSPVLLPCLSMKMRSSRRENVTSKPGSETGSPVIPMQFPTSGWSHSVKDLNPIPHIADGWDSHDYNPEASQSLFTPISSTAENEGLGDLNLGEGDVTLTPPEHDSFFSQNMFVASQESLPEATGAENTETEAALHDAISTLCERLGASAEDDNTQTPTQMAVHESQEHPDSATFAFGCNDSTQVIPTPTVTPSGFAENETSLEPNEEKKREFLGMGGAKGFNCDIGTKEVSSIGSTAPSENGQNGQNHHERDDNVPDDNIAFPSNHPTENPLSEVAENTYVNQPATENEAEDHCGSKLGHDQATAGGCHEKEFLVVNKDISDIRHDGLVKCGSANGTDSGESPANGESASCVASDSAIGEIIQGDSTGTTSDPSTTLRANYPRTTRISQKFKVPYAHSKRNSNGVKSFSEISPVEERKKQVYIDDVPTDCGSNEGSVAHTRNNNFGTNMNSSLINKNRMSHLQNDSQLSSPVKKGLHKTSAPPTQTDNSLSGKSTNVNEKAVTELEENFQKKKDKDRDTHTEYEERSRNKQGSHKSGHFIQTVDNINKHDGTSAKNRLASENTSSQRWEPHPGESRGNRHSEDEKTARNRGGTEVNTNSQSDDETLVAANNKIDDERSVASEGGDVGGTSVGDSKRPQECPRIGLPFAQNSPSPKHQKTSTEERTDQTLQNILSRVMAISDTVRIHGKMDHERELALLKQLHETYAEASDLASAWSADQRAGMTGTVEVVIRDINKWQQEEKTTLADRVKRGRMTSAEKSVTKQRLQQLTLRCTTLQAVVKVHRELKRSNRAAKDKPTDRDSSTHVVKSSGSNNKSSFNETQSSDTASPSPQTERHATHATEKPGTQCVDKIQQTANIQAAPSENGQNTLSNVSEDDLSVHTTKPGHDRDGQVKQGKANVGDKVDTVKTFPLESADVQSGHISTDNAPREVGEMKSRVESTTDAQDEEAADNSSLRSQSILMTRPVTGLQSKSSDSSLKSGYPTFRAEEICAKERSDVTLLETVSEIPASMSFRNREKQRSSQELSSLITSKIHTKADKDKHLSSSLTKTPQALLSECSSENSFQNSALKRKGQPPQLSSTAKNSRPSDVFSSRIQDSKGVHGKNVSQSIRAVDSGPQHVSKSLRDRMNIPIKDSSEIQETDNVVMEAPGFQDADLVILPHDSKNLKHTSGCLSLAPMSPDSTLPPDCGSLSPDSVTKSPSVLQSGGNVGLHAQFCQPSSEQSNDLKNMVASGPLENGTKRSAEDLNVKIKNMTGTSESKATIGDQVSNGQSTVQKEITLTGNPLSKTTKRLRSLSPPHSTASNDSVVIVSISPKAKHQKTDRVLPFDVQQSASEKGSSGNRKTALTRECTDHVVEKNEPMPPSSQSKQTTNTISRQTDPAVYNNQGELEAEGEITYLTQDAVPQLTLKKGFGANTDEQRKQADTSIPPAQPAGQILCPTLTIQAKQTKENQQVVHSISLISQKQVSELSVNSGHQPLPKQTLKPPQATVVIVRKPIVQTRCKNSILRPVPVPPRTASPSSSMTSMTGVFPVSSQEIVRKMAQETTLKKEEFKGSGWKLNQQQQQMEVIVTQPVGGLEKTNTGNRVSAGRGVPGKDPDHGKVDKSGDDQPFMDTGTRDLRQTKSDHGPKPPPFAQLFRTGVVQPGNLNLSCSFKGCEKKASILKSGRVQDQSGLIFSSPLTWFRAVTALTQAKRPTAYRQTFYKGRTLADISYEAAAQHQGHVHPTPSPPPNNAARAKPLSCRPTPINRLSQNAADENPRGPQTVQRESNPREHQTASQGGIEYPPPASHQTESESRSAPPQTKPATGSSVRPSSSAECRVSSEEAPATKVSLSASRLIGALRRLRLIEDLEVVPHASSAELLSFWAADFAQVTMTPSFWATVDDW